MSTIAVRKNEPINYYYNVSNSVSGSWTAFVSNLVNPVALVGVYWEGVGSLQLRDANNHVFYWSSSGSFSSIDYLSLPLPVRGPIKYNDFSGSAVIRLFGSFV